MSKELREKVSFYVPDKVIMGLLRCFKQREIYIIENMNHFAVRSSFISGLLIRDPIINIT